MDRTVGFAVVGVVLELVADLNDVAVLVVVLVLDVFVDGNNVVVFVNVVVFGTTEKAKQNTLLQLPLQFKPLFNNHNLLKCK